MPNEETTNGGRTIGPIPFPVNIEYPDSALVPHPLLRDANDLVVVFAPSDAFYCGRELPPVETLSSLHIPESESVIG